MSYKLFKKTMATILSFLMVFSMITVMPVSAADEMMVFDEDANYSIIDSKGKAVIGTALNWQKNVSATGDYFAETKEVDKNGVFKFVSDGSGKYQIKSLNLKDNDNKSGLWRSEKDGAATGVFMDTRNDECSKFVVEKVTATTGYIKDNWGKYIKIDDAKDLVRVGNKEDAELFTFVKDVTAIDKSCYIKNVGTKGFVSFADQPDAGNQEISVVETTLSDAEKFIPTFQNNDNGPFKKVVSFQSVSKSKLQIASAKWEEGAGAKPAVRSYNNGGTPTGGWEAIAVEPAGNGYFYLKDSANGTFVTVKDGKLQGGYDGEITDNEKFIINSTVPIEATTDLSVNDSTRTETTIDLSWTNPITLYTDVFLYQKASNEETYKKIADLTTETSYTATELTPGVEYTFKLVYVNGNGNLGAIGNPSAESNAISARTRAGAKPATPSKVEFKSTENGAKLSWSACENATHYQVMRADSMYGKYEAIKTVDKNTLSTNVTYTNADKYKNYYRIVALNNGGATGSDYSGAERSEQSEYVSLETEMFGRNTIIFAPTDDVKQIDDRLSKLFEQQHDFNNDAQFKANQYQVYFKPGSYEETSCIDLGFYTSLNGLGKLPTDVKLNNIAIPAYLPKGELGGDGFNATCNFWRSAENLSVIDTGNEQGKAGHGSWRTEHLNWAVAQAAPMRRVYSSRPVSYDWNYGWASGGYVADCKFDGTFDDNGQELTAGTKSGQQFYTRNSELAGGAFGCTLNNFFQGVKAPNLPRKNFGDQLINGNGYTNWGIAAASDKENVRGGHQIFTNIEETKKLSEKPFLYLDGDEYKVFVPEIRENISGVSWGDGKANDGMGEGYSIPLSEFYVAKPGDTAEEINEQIKDGKDIYFTPGKYYVDEPILVNHDKNKDNTILLGTGMCSIIPTNDEAAMIVSDDLDGVRVAGLIFDAGTYSKYLLKVGEDNSNQDHSKNPTVLQDIFFRIGGTTNQLTKADDALIINSDDVLCDHFWIWRADHGTGVAWDGNVAKHGIIVNGDDVTCYALFNEHFQEYDTLWNGERGSTYFYQNEKCYDPFTQSDWMSHDDTVNGYAAYKVSDNVKEHYAVGLGIYNVFIYAGGNPGKDGNPGSLGDSKNVSIQMDNAIEVPNSEKVIVENACIQTFANEDGALQKFNHIINGVGDGVSSGHTNGQPTGEGWSRKFLLSYQNGTAVVGKNTVRVPGSADFVPAKGDDNRYDDRGVFLGVDTIKNVVDATGLKNTYAKSQDINESDKYTDASWELFDTARVEAKNIIDKLFSAEITQKVVDDATKALAEAMKGLDELGDKTELQKLYDECIKYDESLYTSDSYSNLKDALYAAKEVLDNTQATKDDVANAIELLQDAKGNLVLKADKTELLKLFNDNKDKDESKYTPSTFTKFKKALNKANSVLNDDNATQDEVNIAKNNLQTAIDELLIRANLKPLEIAIERANKIIAGDNYQKGYYVEFTKDIFDYYYELGMELMANKDELDVREQALIEARAANIHNGIDQLLLMPANTGDLEKLIKFAEDKIRDGEYFNNEWYINVAKFLDYLQIARNVVEDSNITDQAEIDKAYENLYNAIKGLKLKPADYEELNSLRKDALDIVAGDDYINNRYTEETVAVFNRVHAQAKVFSNSYMIPDQKVVDQQAKELDDAIKQLRLKDEKPVDPDVPVDPETPVDPEKPENKPETPNKPTTPEKVNNKSGNSVKTGDDAIVAGYAMLGLLAAGTYTVLKRKKEN